jgi:hypothetical protein
MCLCAQAIVEDQKTFLPVHMGESTFTVYDVQNVIYKVCMLYACRNRDFVSVHVWMYVFVCRCIIVCIIMNISVSL